MILLDTDHLSVLKYRTGQRAVRLSARLLVARADDEVGTTVISFEEQMKGWLASLNKEKLPHRLVPPYRELLDLIEFFRGWDISPFGDDAADLFAGMGRIRVKATDQRIAAIALANGALLLTANRRDFGQVPGLRFANWLDG